MHDHEFARIALALAPDDPHAPYYREALEHAGIPFERLTAADFERLGDYDVLLLCGSGDLATTQRQQVHSWLRLGGGLVCSGSTWGMEDDLGVAAVPGRSPSRELVFPVVASDRAWPGQAGPARTFGGVYARPTDAKPVAQTASGTLAASRRRMGKGAALFLAPHVGQTMALVQMGRSVETDAVGPNDGSAILHDHRLRAEDGIVLDYAEDRSQPGESAHPCFTSPHADILRELWIRLIVEAAEAVGKRVALFWPWPNAAEGAACISVDCEEFNPANVASLHNVLAMGGGSAAWLVGQPGYPLDVYRSIRKWEHEVGILFAPNDDGSPCEEKLKVQHVAMSRVVSGPVLSSIRMPDGAWYRLDRFYEIAEATGSRVSLCKGGRQPGTSGFGFGTCHPFHPLKADGEARRILEIPYQIYMPGHIVDEPAVEAIVLQTAARSGCLHTVVASPAAQDSRVSLALRRTIAIAKQAHLEFMLPAEIARYERVRRTLRIRPWREGVASGFNLIGSEALEGLTLMISGPPVAIHVEGKALKTRSHHRLGTEWTAAVFDLPAKAQLGIMLGPPLAAAA